MPGAPNSSHSLELDSERHFLYPVTQTKSEIRTLKTGVKLAAAAAIAVSGSLNSLNPRPEGDPFSYPETKIIEEPMIPGAGLNESQISIRVEIDPKDRGRNGTFYYGPDVLDSDSSDITDWYSARRRQLIRDHRRVFHRELYTKEDDQVIDQDLTELEYAHQDFVISSWEGINDARDQFMQHIKSLNENENWEHSDMDWTFEEEREGFGNPTKKELHHLLDYQEKEYFHEDWFLKDENGKPVVFVYSSDTDTGEYLKKWVQIQAERNEAAKNDPTGEKMGLHVVLKSFRGYNSHVSIPTLEQAQEALRFLGNPFSIYSDVLPWLMSHISEAENLLDFVNPANAGKVLQNPYFEYVDDVDWYDYQPVFGIVVNKDSVTISPAYARPGDWRVRDYDQKAWIRAVSVMTQLDKKWKLTISFKEKNEGTSIDSKITYNSNECHPNGKQLTTTSRLDVLNRIVPPNPKLKIEDSNSLFMK